MHASDIDHAVNIDLSDVNDIIPSITDTTSNLNSNFSQINSAYLIKTIKELSKNRDIIPETNNTNVIDYEAWFTDEDIFNYLSDKIKNLEHSHINPCKVSALAEHEESKILTVNEYVHSSTKVFCPLNIKNEHWVLAVYCKISLSCFYVDPLKHPFLPEVAHGLLKNLVNNLNSIFGILVKIIDNPYKNLVFQSNGYDCGPFICAYATYFSSNKTGRIKISDKCIIKIRNRAFKLKNKPENKYKRKGGGKINNNKTLNNINEVLSYFFASSPDVMILPAETTSHLINENLDYIVNNLSLKQFKNIKIVICFFLLYEQPLLFVFDSVRKSSFVTNPYCLNISDDIYFVGESLTYYINKFILSATVTFEYRNGSGSDLVEIGDLDAMQKLFFKIIFKTCHEKEPDLVKFNSEVTKFNVLKPKINENSLFNVNSRIDNKTIKIFFDQLPYSETTSLLDSTESSALVEGNFDHLQLFTNLDRLENSSIIFAFFCRPGTHVLLLILNFKLKSYFVVNPTSLSVNEKDIEFASTLTSRICEIIDRPMNFCLANGPVHDVRGSGFFSNLLLCAVIKNYISNMRLTELDLKSIRDTISVILGPLKPKHREIPDFIPAEPKLIATKNDNIESRSLRAKRILDSLNDKSPNEIMDHIISYFPHEKFIKKPYLGKKARCKTISKSDLRKSFNRNMKKTFDKIISDTNTEITPCIDEIIKFYSHDAPLDKTWDFSSYKKFSVEILKLKSIYPSEILYEFKQANKSAPGHDHVTYANLREIDPDGIILCHLFNTIILQNKMPDAWSTFQTILIPKPDKGGQYKDITSWRPIALLCTSYKIFSSILSRRLTNWLKSNKILFHGQKGGSTYEGCIEHNAILSCALEHSRYTENSPVVITWLDISNAFPSVPHNYLWSLMSHVGIDSGFINMMKLFYKDTHTFYTCGNITTPHIPVRKGVRQGCPISMILFALAIDPVLDAVKSMKIPSYMLGDNQINVLAYADDIAIISKNTDDMQCLLNKAIEKASECDMYFQPKKCAYLMYPSLDNHHQVSINNIPIRKLCVNEFYKYLGVPIGLDYDQSPYEILSKLLSDLNKIAFSDLYDWQKLLAYKTFLHPRLNFAFRTRHIKNSAFSGSKSTKDVNYSTKLRSLFRKILSLPDYSELCHLYALVDDGGVGLTDLKDEYHIQSVVQTFRLLTTPCKFTNKIIRQSFIDVSSSRIGIGPKNINRCLQWINGQLDPKISKGKKTWWSRFLDSISFFKDSHNISIALEFVEDEFNMRITTNSEGTRLLTSDDRGDLSFTLHLATKESYSEKWQNSVFSSHLANTLQLYPTINKCIFTGDIGSFTFNFIHRARTNTLPVNDHPRIKNELNKICRRCRSEKESMSHVLQVCRPNRKLIAERHDACLKKIFGALLSPNLIVTMNQQCSLLPECDLRIDLMITNVETKNIFLVDVKCPLDSEWHFENSEKLNKEHYKNLSDSIKSLKPDYKVSLHTCILGSLGTIPPSATNIMKTIGIPEKTAKSLLKACSISNMEYSAKIWHFHSTGNFVNFF